jgi:hypothetical protein
MLFCLFIEMVATNAALAATDPCALAPGLSAKIAQEFTGTHVEKAADLSEYDRRLFRKDHGGKCPGLVKINFYGDAKPTWALVLIENTSSSKKTRLLLAQQAVDSWELRLVEETDGTPVVWRQPPGKYEGMNESKSLHAKFPVIVFCGYGSWAILYAWTGKEIEKIWLSD